MKRLVPLYGCMGKLLLPCGVGLLAEDLPAAIPAVLEKLRMTL